MHIIYDADNALIDVSTLDKLIPLCKSAAGYALEEEKIASSSVEAGLILVTPDEIQKLNREYRKIDEITDVLSFPQYTDADEIRNSAASSGAEETVIGDVVICVERAHEQAEEYGHSFEREFVYLFTHSIFHLLGYDHMSNDEKKIMREKEEKIMDLLSLSRKGV